MAEKNRIVPFNAEDCVDATKDPNRFWIYFIEDDLRVLRSSRKKTNEDYLTKSGELKTHSTGRYSWKDERMLICSSSYGHEDSLFFPSSKEAEASGEKIGLEGFHVHEEGISKAKEVGPIYMPGENHLIYKFVRSSGVPKTSSEKELLERFSMLSKTMMQAQAETEETEVPVPPPLPPRQDIDVEISPRPNIPREEPPTLEREIEQPPRRATGGGY